MTQNNQYAPEPFGDLHLVPLTDARERAASISKQLRVAARKSRAPTVFVSGGGGFKARKGARLFFYGLVASFLSLVLVPIVAISVYYAFIASDQYATEIKFALKSSEPSVLDSISGLAGLPSSQQAQDSRIIVAYIKSRSMVDEVMSNFNFENLYARSDIDYISRFTSTVQIENIVKYWNRRVDASVESQSNIISVEVRAFAAEESLQIAQQILQSAENLINRMSERARQAALKQSKDELERAQNALQLATDALRNARNEEGVLDPNLTAEVAGKVITVLRTELSAREQDYSVRSRDIDLNSPPMKILAAQIANLKSQIEKAERQLTSKVSPQLKTDGPLAQGALSDTGGGKVADTPKTLSASMSVLERFQVDLTLAQQQYASAAAAYEAARADVESQHAYLTPFVTPTLAEKPIYPKRWWSWALLVVPDIFIWLILVGVSFLIRDHMV